jgi:glycosyltransferase involved in cell wall biosynthesis
MATPRPDADAGLPLVSVIMPIRNEAGFITRSLGAVQTQDYPRERIEILVVDGASTDATRAIVLEASRTDPRVRLFDNPAGIVATGMNRALPEARGDVVVRVDGHCEIAPDYVRRCAAHLAGGDAEGVGGSLETVGEGSVARAIAVAMSSPFGVGNSAFRTRQGETRLVDTVPFPAYRRETLQRAGPYDEELVRNQDDEYNFRIRRLGGRILLAADVHSRYHSRTSLASLWRQYFQYGYFKVRVMQKHPLQMRARHFVPAVFVSATAALAIGAAVWPPARVILAVLLGLYACAGLAAAWRAASGDRRAPLPVVWLCFPILHFAYGSGFLWGLLRFAGRWGDRGEAGAAVEGVAPGRV